MAIIDRTPVGGSLERLIVNASPNGVETAAKGSTALDITSSAIWRNVDGATAWKPCSSLTIVGAQPGINDDRSAGYEAGDMVIYPALGLFVCADASIGAAGWALFSPIASASRAPGINDDQTKGFNLGHLWIDSSASGALYFLQDKSTGAAVWLPMFDAEGDQDFVANGKFRATYDFSVHGGAVGSNPFGPELPDKAYVTRAHLQVLVTLTSPTGPDNATGGLGIVTDDPTGLVPSVAINDVSNPWDAAPPIDTTADGTAANFSTQTLARRRFNFEVGVEDITAGKFVVFGDYATTE